MVNELWAYPSYHSIANSVGHIKHAPKVRRDKRRTYFYQIKDDAGKVWFEGKCASVAKQLDISPQRIHSAAAYGFTLLGRFTVTREEMR